MYADIDNPGNETRTRAVLSIDDIFFAGLHLLRVHVDGSLTVLDGSVVIGKFGEGSCAIAVEHLVRVVDFNGSEKG
jgi:hypothetical protein